MAEDVSTSHSRLKSCLMIGLIPVVLMLVLVGAFVANNRPPHITVPTPKMPKNNGWDYFVRAGEMTEEIGHLGPYDYHTRKPEEWTAAELQAFVNANKPAVAVLRQGLTKPYRHHPDHDPSQTPEGHDRFYRHYQRLCKLARVLAGESFYYRKIGLYAQAANAQLDAIEMGVTFPRGGSKLAMLRGIAIERIGEWDIHQVVAHLNVQELAQVARRLETIQRKRTPCGESIVEEGYSIATELAVLLGGPDRFSRAWNPSPWDPHYADGIERYWQSGKFGFRNKQQLLQEVLEYSGVMARECNRPFREQSRVPVPDNLICKRLAMHYKSAQFTHCMAQARLTIIQLEAALRRCKLDSGHYPARLSDVSPRYMDGIPVDPMGGGPLKYKPTKGGNDYLLYSVGPNLKDDGGKPGECIQTFEPEDLVAGQY